MPCKFDDHDETAELERSYNALALGADRLQQELCRTQELVIELAGILETANLFVPTRVKNAIFRTKRQWKRHREKDKKRAIAAALGPFSALELQVQNIIDLGGMPGPDLVGRLETALAEVTKLRDSDPLTTKLY